MLSRLIIRNIVLTEKLDITFSSGLCVLTGETGAGKSVLLDSLNLALGKRSESRLVRKGAEHAEVMAEFDLPLQHSLYKNFEDLELFEVGETLVLRRKISADGRSKAWVNGHPVSAQILKQIGSVLLEIHGQFETQKLLDSAIHKSYLDKYGRHQNLLQNVKQAWENWKQIEKEHLLAKQALEKQQQDEEFLRFSAEELQKINPIAGEEGELSEKRSLMKSAHDLLSSLDEASQTLENEGGILSGLRKVMRLLDKANEKAEGRFDNMINILEEASIKADEALMEIQQIQQDFDFSPYALEELEERLFTLRNLARKHNVSIDELAQKQIELEQALELLDNSDDYLKELAQKAQAAKRDYIRQSQELTQAREQTAHNLDKALNKELIPLHLEKAQFKTLVTPLEENLWNKEGCENIEFQVSTHKGADFGTIGKIASGGELARFTLALRIVLAKVDDLTSLVLDEADAGISGRVADAMGERLKHLSSELQIIVVTHSPQIAAQGEQHWLVRKTEDNDVTRTSAQKLEPFERIEAIAAMLSGKKISDEAREAAKILLKIKE